MERTGEGGRESVCEKRKIEKQAAMLEARNTAEKKALIIFSKFMRIDECALIRMHLYLAEICE